MTRVTVMGFSLMMAFSTFSCRFLAHVPDTGFPSGRPWHQLSSTGRIPAFAHVHRAPHKSAFSTSLVHISSLKVQLPASPPQTQKSAVALTTQWCSQHALNWAAFWEGAALCLVLLQLPACSCSELELSQCWSKAEPQGTPEPDTQQYSTDVV